MFGMTGEHEQTNSGDVRLPAGFERRRVLQTLGAATAATTLGVPAAAAGSGDHERNRDRTADGIHPVFGYTGLSAADDPPVEPDHVIDAEFAERPDREFPEFFFEPAGLYVEPGDVLQVRLASPHHSMTAYHPGFGTGQRVPDGVPPFSSPVLPVGAYWLYAFDHPGVYDVHCGPHELFGHVARIVVGEPTGPGAEPLPGPEAMADSNGPAENDPGDPGAPTEPAGNEKPVGKDKPSKPDHDARGEGEPKGEPPAEEGEPEGRPPVGAALTVLGDPALAPDRIVARGRVSWDEIAEESKRVEL